jgi:hypothetical protein
MAARVRGQQQKQMRHIGALTSTEEDEVALGPFQQAMQQLRLFG